MGGEVRGRQDGGIAPTMRGWQVLSKVAFGVLGDVGKRGHT